MPRPILNAFLAAIVIVITIDTLPQSPPALQRALTPFLVRLGINQGPWALFAPDPDRTNTRISAEITYRDGEQRTWHAPDWSRMSAWDKWRLHRHGEWYDHVTNYKHGQLYEAWCRHIARAARPEMTDADQGAEVRIIVAEATMPPVAERPWRSFREPMPFDERWVLTIEQLE
jgi:hypothetical protein